MPRPLYAVKHVVTAGSDFNGKTPGTTPSDSNGLRIYPTDTDGGRIYFDILRGLSQPMAVQQILLFLGGQISWSINVAMHATDVLASASRTLEFKDNTPSADSIEASSGSFLTDGYCCAMEVTVTGTTLNNGTYKIASVTDTVITLEISESLSNEGPFSSGAKLETKTLIEVDNGTNEASYYWNDATPIIILPGQCLEIITSGASTAMWAWMIFTPHAIGGF